MNVRRATSLAAMAAALLGASWASAPTAGAPSAARAASPTGLVEAAPGSYFPMPPNIQVAETHAGTWTLLVSVPLNRPNATGQPLTIRAWECVGFAFCNTTATPGSDFVSVAPLSAPQILTWAPGAQVAVFRVRIKGDRVAEPSEWLDIRFDGAAGPWNSPVSWDNNADILIGNDD